jgi:hypothetical protein
VHGIAWHAASRVHVACGVWRGPAPGAVRGAAAAGAAPPAARRARAAAAGRPAGAPGRAGNAWRAASAGHVADAARRRAREAPRQPQPIFASPAHADMGEAPYRRPRPHPNRAPLNPRPRPLPPPSSCWLRCQARSCHRCRGRRWAAGGRPRRRAPSSRASWAAAAGPPCRPTRTCGRRRRRCAPVTPAPAARVGKGGPVSCELARAPAQHGRMPAEGAA